MANPREVDKRYRSADVEVAIFFSATPWPTEKLEKQKAKVLSIDPAKWKRYVGGGFAPKHFAHLASFVCKTPFGERWFDVWEKCSRRDYPHRPYEFAVIKPRNNTTLVLHCTLSISTVMSAEYTLLSGESCGVHVFATLDQDLTMNDLKNAAKEFAITTRLLESPTQKISVLLQDLSHPLPSQIVLWTKRAALLPNNDPDVAVLGLRLAAWTSHLRTRTFRELDNLSEGLDSATYMEQFLGLSTPMSVMEYLEKLARSRSPRRHYQGLTDSTDSSD